MVIKKVMHIKKSKKKKKLFSYTKKVLYINLFILNQITAKKKTYFFLKETLDLMKFSILFNLLQVVHYFSLNIFS